MTTSSRYFGGVLQKQEIVASSASASGIFNKTEQFIRQKNNAWPKDALWNWPVNTIYTFTSNVYAGGYTYGSGTTSTQLPPSYATLLSMYSSSNTDLYNLLNTNNFFRVPTDGYQMLIIPSSGDYNIQALGGPGGDTNKSGTYGTSASATFTLDKGEILWMTIGHAGSSGNASASDWCSAAGGGATFVARGNAGGGYTISNISEYLICAAGGFGAYEGRFSNTTPSPASGYTTGWGAGWTSFANNSMSGLAGGYAGYYSHGGWGGGNGSDDSYGAAGCNSGMYAGAGDSYVNTTSSRYKAGSVSTGSGGTKYYPGWVKVTKL